MAQSMVFRTGPRLVRPIPAVHSAPQPLRGRRCHQQLRVSSEAGICTSGRAHRARARKRSRKERTTSGQTKTSSDIVLTVPTLFGRPRWSCPPSCTQLPPPSLERSSPIALECLRVCAATCPEPRLRPAVVQLGASWRAAVWRARPGRVHREDAAVVCGTHSGHPVPQRVRACDRRGFSLFKSVSSVCAETHEAWELRGTCLLAGRVLFFERLARQRRGAMGRPERCSSRPSCQNARRCGFTRAVGSGPFTTERRHRASWPRSRRNSCTGIGEGRNALSSVGRVQRSGVLRSTAWPGPSLQIAL